MRTTQAKCPICSGDHAKRDCRLRCKHCSKTGHAHSECYRKPSDSTDGKNTKAQKDPKNSKDSKKSSTKKTQPKGKGKNNSDGNKTPKVKNDSQGRRVESDQEEITSELESPTEEEHFSNRLSFPDLDSASATSIVRRWQISRPSVLKVFYYIFFWIEHPRGKIPRTSKTKHLRS